MTAPWTANRSSSFVHFPFSFRPLCNTHHHMAFSSPFRITKKYCNTHSRKKRSNKNKKTFV